MSLVYFIRRTAMIFQLKADVLVTIGIQAISESQVPELCVSVCNKHSLLCDVIMGTDFILMIIIALNHSVIVLQQNIYLFASFLPFILVLTYTCYISNRHSLK